MISQQNSVLAKNILVQAKELIAKEENWTQGAMARTSSGKQTLTMKSNAACFCSVGALEKVAYAMSDTTIAESAQARLRCIELLNESVVRLTRGHFCSIPGIVAYNDIASHSKVLEAFDLAIEMCGI